MAEDGSNQSTVEQALGRTEIAPDPVVCMTQAAKSEPKHPSITSGSGFKRDINTSVHGPAKQRRGTSLVDEDSTVANDPLAGLAAVYGSGTSPDVVVQQSPMAFKSTTEVLSLQPRMRCTIEGYLIH